jgi:hypothetical protein
MGDLMKPDAIDGKSLVVLGLYLALASGCGRDLDVGSDILWTARFEGNNFDEWKRAGGDRGDQALAPNTIEVSSDISHLPGSFAAKLTASGTANNTQGFGASLVRDGNQPTEAYYSAWYYLPQSISVGLYWVIMKFRYHSVAGDPTTGAELFDVNLSSQKSGEMSLRVYDHGAGSAGSAGSDGGAGSGGHDLPLLSTVKATPKISVGKEWFQIEVFYRNAADGRFTLWLDGQEIIDTSESTGSDGWLAWDVVSVGYNLSPEPAVLYVDDCAISRTRVGPSGLLSE